MEIWEKSWIIRCTDVFILNKFIIKMYFVGFKS